MEHKNPVKNRKSENINQIERYLDLYNQLGFNLIPQKEDKPIALKSWKKYQRTKSLPTERKEWFINKGYNIGIVCGAISGNLAVVDVDNPNLLTVIFPNIEQLKKNTLVVKSPNGYHIYFRTKTPFKNTSFSAKGKTKPLIEIKGEGGVITAPPSRIGEKEYVFLSTSDSIAKIEESQADLEERIREALIRHGIEPKGNKEIDPDELWNLKLREGEGRNNVLIRLATWCRKEKLSLDEAIKKLREWNEQQIDPLSESEFLSTIKSAYKPAKPYAYRFKKKEKKTEQKYYEVLPEGVDISDNERVVVDEKGIKIIRYREKDGLYMIRSHVYTLMGKFRVIRKLNLDGEDVFEIETSRFFRGNAEEILQQLRKEGVVVNRHKISDSVNALLQKANNIITGHATFGVYQNSNGLDLCLDPLPRSDSHRRIAQEVKPSLNYQARKEDIEAWIKIQDFWHQYEILPIMGLSAIAPFSYVLRKNRIIIPYLFHKSPESGLGKTFTIDLFTRRLFGVTLRSVDSIKSDFRLADTLDSFCGLIGIEEAENYSWNKFAPHLQQAAEQPIQDYRGTPYLGMRQYLSRATFAFTGNFFPTRRKALLVRFIVVDFDRSKFRERRNAENKKRLRMACKNLKPIGWELVRTEMDVIDGKIENLNKRIEKHDDVFSNNFEFEDARRSTLWAIIYEGVLIWQELAQAHNIDWKSPEYDEFIKKVISPIESIAFQSVEQPAEQFYHWWLAWKSLHTQGREDEEIIRGENKFWRRCDMQIDNECIEGDCISKSVLTLYRKENKDNPLSDLTLVDLAKGIAALFELPEKEIYKDRRIGEKVRKTVFIPDEEIRTTKSKKYYIYM